MVIVSLYNNRILMGEFLSVSCECQSFNKGAVLAHDRHLRKGRRGNQNREEKEGRVRDRLLQPAEEEGNM